MYLRKIIWVGGSNTVQFRMKALYIVYSIWHEARLDRPPAGRRWQAWRLPIPYRTVCPLQFSALHTTQVGTHTTLFFFFSFSGARRQLQTFRPYPKLSSLFLRSDVDGMQAPPDGDVCVYADSETVLRIFDSPRRITTEHTLARSLRLSPPLFSSPSLSFLRASSSGGLLSSSSQDFSRWAPFSPSRPTSGQWLGSIGEIAVLWFVACKISQSHLGKIRMAYSLLQRGGVLS
jgi:hypothetical protein